jgi:hypothetical protein
MKYDLKHSSHMDNNPGGWMLIKVDMYDTTTKKIVDTIIVRVTGHSIADDPQLIKFKEKMRILNLEAEDDKLYVNAVKSIQSN